MEIEVIDAVASRERQNSVSDPSLCCGIEDVFRDPDTNIPNLRYMFRGELGVAGGGMQLCNSDRSRCIFHVYTFDRSLHQELLSIPEVRILDAVRFIHVVVAIGAMKL